MTSSYSLLSIILPRIPVMLVMLTAIILAIVFWRKHPNVSLFTVIGSGGILIINVISALINIRMQLALVELNVSYSRLEASFQIWTIAYSILNMVFWGLIIAAIFGWRNKPAVTSVPPVYSMRR